MNDIDLKTEALIEAFKEESTYYTCDECGEVLPDPEVESKEDGQFELVTNCECGEIYKE